MTADKYKILRDGGRSSNAYDDLIPPDILKEIQEEAISEETETSGGSLSMDMSDLYPVNTTASVEYPEQDGLSKDFVTPQTREDAERKRRLLGAANRSGEDGGVALDPSAMSPTGANVQGDKKLDDLLPERDRETVRLQERQSHRRVKTFGRTM